MIDIHTHVLPGIDDGSRDLRTSMRMLMMAYKYGTRRVIATPHFRGGSLHSDSGSDLPINRTAEREHTDRRPAGSEGISGNEILYDSRTSRYLREAESWDWQTPLTR